MNPCAPHSAPSPATREGMSLPKVTTRAGASAGVTDPESSGLSTVSPFSAQVRWTLLVRPPWARGGGGETGPALSQALSMYQEITFHPHHSLRRIQELSPFKLKNLRPREVQQLSQRHPASNQRARTGRQFDGAQSRNSSR